ncbi:hypothetical protein PMIN07_012284 [Paraphaeosphaeria minitans]
MPSHDIYNVGDALNQSIPSRPTRRPLTISRPPPAAEEEGVRLFSISPPRGNDNEFDFSAFSSPELWPRSPATRDVSKEAEEPRVTSRQLTPTVSKWKALCPLRAQTLKTKVRVTIGLSHPSTLPPPPPPPRWWKRRKKEKEKRRLRRRREEKKEKRRRTLVCRLIPLLE